MIARPYRLIAFALICAAPIRGRAQAAAAPAPWGLFNVRYDTRTSDFIYAAYGYGKTFAMVGALENPRSGYTELLGGVGRMYAAGEGYSHAVAAAVARASDAWYAQLYYLPSIHAGPAHVRATSEWYIPVDRAGTLQFAFSPLSGTFTVTRYLEAGLAIDLAAQQHDKTGGAVGPELRLALPKATLGLDAQRMVNANASRARVFFSTAF